MAGSKNEAEVEVVSQDQASRAENKNIIPARFVFPQALPVLPLMSRPIFPKMMVPLAVDDAALK
ncbi:MAG: hypothetical protein WCG36_01175, partial [bacterium]